MSEHDAGFHLDRQSIAQVRPKPPLRQSICNGFGLVGKSTEKMNVLNLAFFINDDPHGNGVESALRENRIFSLDDVLVACVSPLIKKAR